MKRSSNKILRLYVGDKPLFVRAQGKFAEAMAKNKSSGELYLIGGAARAIIFGGDFAKKVNDYDFTIIGKYQRQYIRHCSRGDHRVEIENSAGYNKTKQNFMEERDLSINQIMIDRFGYAYITEGAYNDYQNKIIRYCGTSEPTKREVVRAFRFAYEANFSVEEKIINIAEAMDYPDYVYDRYRRQASVPNMEWKAFVSFVLKGGHRYGTH